MEKTIHAALNVEVIDEAFYIPQLNRNRRIWVYKPAGYFYTNKRYPVIYMHDGQNLFDENIAFGEEWGIDDTLNEMMGDCIIVGIDNSEYRMTEYNFNDHKEHGFGEGRKYISFITDTLKPIIDLNFRTLSQREHTHIAGSSMGGLISLYGALHFAETFGSAGIFSPALWLHPTAATDLKAIAEKNAAYPQRFYFYGGARESKDMIKHISTIAEMLNSHAHYIAEIDTDPEGEHSESHWRNKFPDYYRWLSKG